MKLLLLKIYFLLLLISCSGALHASDLIQLTAEEKKFLKATPTITLGSDSSWGPFIIAHDNGKISGYDADVLSLINQVSGANFELIVGRWKTLVDAQKERKIDGLSTATKNKQRAGHSNFSNRYISLDKIVLTRKNLTYQANNRSDLKGRKIGIYRGNIASREFADSIKEADITEYDHPKKLIKGLVTGEVDFILGNASTLYQLNKNGNSSLTPAFILSDEPLELVFVLRDDFPQAISIINKSLEIIGKAKLLQLKKKWFSSVISDNEQFKALLSTQEQQYLTQKKQLNLCIDPKWMPFEKIEKGKHIGMSADYFDLFQKSIDIPIILKETASWEQTLKFAENRECDLISLAMQTKDRQRYLSFTSTLLQTPVVLATKPNITFIDDLALIENKKIGIIQGYALNEIIREKYPNIEVVNVSSAQQGLQQVVNGKLFGYIDALATVGYMFQTKFVGELQISGKFDEHWDMRVATRNDEPLLLSIMNKVIKQIPPETHHNIFTRYVAINYKQTFDYKLFWRVISLLVIVSLFFLYRYYTLSKYKRRIQRHLFIIDNHVLTSLSDGEGKILDASNALCELTGYKKEQLIGQNHRIFRHPKTESNLYKSLWTTITQGHVWQGELLNLNKNGSSYWASLKITPTYYRNGKLRGYSTIFHDISDKKRLEKLTITDTLTQIPNRLFINNSFDREFERSLRYESHFSLILIDIDHFKQVNDNYGHNVGDDVLINVATILKQNIRQLDLLGRWGGEEFLIICPETNLPQAEIVAEKVRGIIEQFEFSESLKLTCSFGVTQSHPNDNKEVIFQRADKALYLAKDAGRNKVFLQKN